MVKMEKILKTTETKVQYKKQQFENKLNRVENKPLHGEHLRNIDRKHDDNSTWAWLKLGTLRKETEGLIFAAQEQALQSNVMKAKIQGASANSTCQEKDETLSHLICECPKISQTDYKASALVIMQKIELARLQKPVGTSGREGVRK